LRLFDDFDQLDFEFAQNKSSINILLRVECRLGPAPKHHDLAQQS